MGNEIIKYDDKEFQLTLKQTVAKGASDAEFKMFIEFCKGTGLNPYKKEIWFIKGNKYQNKKGEWVDPPVQMMTGINGFLAIANSHPQFDGMECIIDREKDGKPIKAVAKVYRKDRSHPAVCEAYFSEYYKPGNFGRESIWDKLPSVMIEKVAKSRALREAFPQELNGLYTEEEMPPEYGRIQEDRQKLPEPPKEPEKRDPEAVRQGMREIAGLVYSYDLKAVAKKFNLENGGKKAMLKEVKEKYGAQNEGAVLFSPVAIPDWDEFHIGDMPQAEQKEEVVDDDKPSWMDRELAAE